MSRQNKGGLGNFMQWAESKRSHDDSHHYKPRGGMRNVAVYPQTVNPPTNMVSGGGVSMATLQNRIIQARHQNVAMKRSLVEKNLAQNSHAPPHHQNIEPSSRSGKGSLTESKSDEVRWLERESDGRGSSHISSLGTLEKSLDGPDATNDDAQMSRNSSKTSLDRHSSQNRSQVTSSNKQKNVHHEATSSDEDVQSRSSDSGRENKKPKQKKGKDRSVGASGDMSEKKRQKDKKRRSKRSSEASQMVATELRKIHDHMTLMIDDNRDLMQQVATSAATMADADAAELRREEKMRRREMKSKIDNLLSRGSTYRMPLWRHRLAGERDPSPDTVMKGKQLFRVAALLVLHFYSKPQLSVRRKKQSRKNAVAEALFKNILLFLDACGVWLGKAMKVPLTSIVQDHTLDFNPVDNKLRRHNHTPLQRRMLQLKVRMTAIVHGLCTLETPAPPVLSFLSSLISDGNFFRDGYLYSFEKQKLELDRIGATRNVLSEIDEKTIVSLLASARGGGDVIKNVLQVDGRSYDITRAKLLIKHFLLTRVVVGNVLLSPWQHGVCLKPANNQRHVIFNLRIISTLFYQLLSHVDQEELPKVAHEGKKKKHWKRVRGVDTNGGESPRMISPRSPRLPSTPRPPAAPSTVATFFLKMIDIVMGVDEEEDEEMVAIQNELLRHRKPYQTLQELHMLLLEPDLFGQVQLVIDPWLKQLAMELDEWITNLTRLVATELIRSEAKKHVHIAGSGGELGDDT